MIREYRVWIFEYRERHRFGWREEVGARRCRDRGFRTDASPARRYPARPSRERLAASGWRLGAANIPVSGFPLSAMLPATCHPELPPATRECCISRHKKASADGG
jgi:hypothetical protein